MKRERNQIDSFAMRVESSTKYPTQSIELQTRVA